MLVALLVAVYVLAIIVPVWTVIVCVNGFEQRSVVEWYVDLQAERRRRAYTRTWARPRGRVLV